LQDNILGSQVSAIGYRVRVFGFRCRSQAGRASYNGSTFA